MASRYFPASPKLTHPLVTIGESRSQVNHQLAPFTHNRRIQPRTLSRSEESWRTSRPTSMLASLLVPLSAGTLYYRGKGVRKDTVEARRLYELESKLHDAPAEHDLALMLAADRKRSDKGREAKAGRNFRPSHSNRQIEICMQGSPQRSRLAWVWTGGMAQRLERR
jgi:hypothetical protein